VKLLLVCDDYWHPGRVVREGLELLQKDGFELTVIENGSEVSPEKMKEFPVIIFSKSNNENAQNREKWLTPELQRAFVGYVEEGGGLLVTHSGTAGYRDEAVFTDLIGCSFITHPEQCPVTVIPLKKHPITAGAESFTEKDEHYFIDVTAEDADIFMATYSQHSAQAGGYTRSRGKGRVCVLTPGHNGEVWKNSEYQKILKNAILWCGRRL